MTDTFLQGSDAALVWGAARMIRVTVEKNARAEETSARAIQIGETLRHALLEEGLSSWEIISLAAGLTGKPI